MRMINKIITEVGCAMVVAVLLLVVAGLFFGVWA
jgi:hypothetical protein